MSKLVAALALFGLLLSASAPGVNSPRVFSCNYDLKLVVDGNLGQIRSRSLVRDGHAIPMEFQNHKVEVFVTSADGAEIDLAITLFEKSGEHWYEINPEPLKFSGSLGIPMQFEWVDSGLGLDIAIVVSPYPQ